MMGSWKGKAEDVDEESQDTTAEHSALRLVALGQDREGHLYWKLASNSVFAGSTFDIQNLSTSYIGFEARPIGIAGYRRVQPCSLPSEHFWSSYF